MLAEVWHGVEVEIERLAGKELLSGELCVPAGEQARDLLRGDARGIFRQEALLRHDIEAAEQGEPLVGDQRHDVALAFDRPQLERQRGAARVRPGSCASPAAWRRVRSRHRRRDAPDRERTGTALPSWW